MPDVVSALTDNSSGPENGPAPEASANSAPPPDTKLTRITAAAKAELFRHFTTVGYKRNTRMPKNNADKSLDVVIEKFGLKRDQVSRQLRNWKGINFENSQVKMIINPEDIEDSVYQGLSEDSLEAWVTCVLGDIVARRDVDGSIDATNYLHSIHDQNSAQLFAVKFVHKNSLHACNSLLVSYFKKLTSLAGELFPQSASRVGGQELEFLARDRMLKKEIVAKWKGEHHTVDIPLNMNLTADGFASVGLFLCWCIYFLWSRLFVDEQRPQIQIPADTLVVAYSRPVVYYVAGWTLQRASLALTVQENQRDKFKLFAVSQSVTQKIAKEAGLPCSLVELRQKKETLFCKQSIL